MPRQKPKHRRIPPCLPIELECARQGKSLRAIIIERRKLSRELEQQAQKERNSAHAT